MTRESPATRTGPTRKPPRASRQSYSTNVLTASMLSGREWTPPSESVGELLGRQAGSLGPALVRRFAMIMLKREGDWWVGKLNSRLDELDPGDLDWIISTWDGALSGLVDSWGVAA